MAVFSSFNILASNKHHLLGAVGITRTLFEQTSIRFNCATSRREAATESGKPTEQINVPKMIIYLHFTFKEDKLGFLL